MFHTQRASVVLRSLIVCCLLFGTGAVRAEPKGRIQSFLDSGCFSTRDCIAGLYRSVLRRRPDEDGLRYWSEQVDMGNMTLSDVAQEFRQCPEFHGEVDGVRRREILGGKASDNSDFPANEPEDSSLY